MHENHKKKKNTKNCRATECLILVQIVSDLHIRKKKIKLEITKIN